MQAFFVALQQFRPKCLEQPVFLLHIDLEPTDCWPITLTILCCPCRRDTASRWKNTADCATVSPK